MRAVLASTLLALTVTGHQAGTKQPLYDLLLQGGHVIDAKNNLSAIRDIAITDGKISAVSEHIDPVLAVKAVSVKDLYITPGLVDIHVHVYASTGEKASYAGDYSVWPDGFSFRTGVTTVVDAGSSGYKNFEDFKEHVIDRSQTRVFAFINIVGAGMRGAKFENNLQDMDPEPTAEMARKYPQIIVGVKTAHYAGPEWTPVENAVRAGTLAGIPVMVDFGANKPERPLNVLLTQKLRQGDIYTHCYSGLRNELDASGKVNAGMIAGRNRGVIFDVGHGGGSFAWRVAMPAIQQGFRPDSISTDIHTSGLNSGLKDMLNLMDKFLAMGMSLEDVIRWSTWNPAREIHHEELGNLSIGSPGDVAVLSLKQGTFGFTDMYGARMSGGQKLECQLTVHNGKVVYDLEGLSRPDWKSLPPDYKAVGDSRWDALNPRRKPN